MLLVRPEERCPGVTRLDRVLCVRHHERIRYLAAQAIRAAQRLRPCAGTGNRMDPTKVRITDVYKTSGDPLAKIMRHELKKRGIRKLTVCTSDELPMKPLPEAVQLEAERTGRRSVPGSTAFVPPAAGLAIASFVVRELMAKKESQ